jgi:hypothetical protein
MWVTARMELGLSDLDFFSLTPRDYHLLLDRHNLKLEYHERLHGILCAAVVNTAYRTTKEPMSYEDFMPSRTKKRKPVDKQKAKRMSHKKRETVADRLAQRLMGSGLLFQQTASGQLAKVEDIPELT